MSMSQFPLQPVDAFDVFDYAARNHLRIFKKTYPFIILMTLVQTCVFYMEHVLASHYVTSLFCVVGLILFLFFAGAMLYQTQKTLEEQALSFKEALQGMYRR